MISALAAQAAEGFASDRGSSRPRTEAARVTRQLPWTGFSTSPSNQSPCGLPAGLPEAKRRDSLALLAADCLNADHLRRVSRLLRATPRRRRASRCQVGKQRPDDFDHGFRASSLRAAPRLGARRWRRFRTGSRASRTDPDASSTCAMSFAGATRQPLVRRTCRERRASGRFTRSDPRGPALEHQVAWRAVPPGRLRSSGRMSESASRHPAAPCRRRRW